MSSSPSILFYVHPVTPVFYQSALNAYYLCPSCLRPHETRFCSGRTAISWALCEKHEKQAAAEKKMLLYDPDDLKYFRAALLDGRLANEFYFKRAVSDIGKGDYGGNSTMNVRQSWHLKPNSASDGKTNLSVQDKAGTNGEMKDSEANSPVSGKSASPKLNGTSSEARSDSPSATTSTSITENIRKALSETSSGSAQDSRRTSLSSSPATILTARPIPSTAQAPPSPATPILRPKPATATLSAPPTTTFPTPLITYAHDPEGGCIYSSKPTIRALGASSIRAFNRKKFRTLQSLREQYDACWGQDPSLLTEHNCILADLQTSTLARGIYFKRCNGEYVNAIGEAWSYAEILGLAAEGEEEELGLASFVRNIQQIEEAEAKLGELARSMGRDEMESASRLLGSLTSNNDDGFRFNRCGSTTAAKSSFVSTPTDHDRAADINGNISRYLVPGGRLTKSDLESLNSYTTISSTQHRHQSKRQLHSPDRNKSQAQHHAVDRSQLQPHQVFDNQARNFPSTLTLKLSRKLPTPTLLAREALIHTGKSSEEDTIIVCWAINSQTTSKNASPATIQDPSTIKRSTDKCSLRDRRHSDDTGRRNQRRRT